MLARSRQDRTKEFYQIAKGRICTPRLVREIGGGIVHVIQCFGSLLPCVQRNHGLQASHVGSGNPRTDLGELQEASR